MSNKISPPRLVHRFFRWFCKPELRDHIEGDLIELFQNRLQQKGRKKARLLFAIDVLLLLRPAIMRSTTKNKKHHQYHLAMITNHFKIGWRRLIRNTGYSLINIGGLAMGITVAIFVSFWIHNELSFNKYHENYSSIGQVWSGQMDPNTSEITGGYSMQLPVGTVLKDNFPHLFKHVLKAQWVGQHTIASKESKFNMRGELIEAGALEMLSLKMQKGSWQSLDKMNSVVLSSSTAIAIFGNQDPINRTLTIDSEMEVQVTGIYEDLPSNNRFAEVQFFAPWTLYESSYEWVRKRKNDWDNRPFNVYVQLQPGITMEDANKTIRDLYYKNMPADLLATVDRYKPFVQIVPMSTWHLFAEFKNGKPAAGGITFVWLFGIIGLFVLLLACINFVNLCTARSEKRAKEVGVRKALGSGKQQLIFQFLAESTLLVLLSFVVSAILIVVLQNWFNQLAGKDIKLPFASPVFWLLALAFILFTGLFAGIYPAFYLSSFRPVKVLKGIISPGRLASLPRKILVTIQFTVSVLLILGTLVVRQQIQFALNRPTGYDQSNLVSIRLNDPAFAGKLDVLKSELMATGMIASTTTSSTPLTDVNNFTNGYDWPGKDPGIDAEFGICKITHDFGKTVGWQLVAGRDFNRELGTDSTESIIINEAAVKFMGLKDPVGKRFVDLDEFGKFKKAWTIIGVVKDLVMISPYEPARQTLFYFSNNETNRLHIKIKPGQSMPQVLEKIKSVFALIVPSAMFDYKFVDEEYAKKFNAEERVGKLSGVFAIIAILISCLGLSGLASYVAEQRTREIGIRKTLGASVTQLWQLLSADFVIIVFISCLIAIPPGYFLMDAWLQKYQYHTGIPWWIFFATTLAAVIITLLSVSYQCIRTAMLNPVKSLKIE